jgi:hypothetical protein
MTAGRHHGQNGLPTEPRARRQPTNAARHAPSRSTARPVHALNPPGSPRGERISDVAKPRSQTRGLESVKVFSILSILFAIAGALAGLKGAYYWYVSSTVSIERWGGNRR